MRAMNDPNFNKVPTASLITDIKETSKRIQQLSYVAFIICFITIASYLIYSLFITAMLLGILMVGISICIYYNRKGFQKITKPVLLGLIMVFLLITGFTNGLAAGGHLYYLPLLFALPLITETTKSSKIELGLYFIFNSLCFAISVIFCPQKSTWQHIPDEMYQSMYYINTCGSMLVSTIFVYFSYYFEKKYATALVNQIARAEDAMHIRTRFLSNMGHELRTPLNGITGITSLLKKENLTNDQKEYVRLLKYCSDQMLNLVNDVLDFNKIESGKLLLHPIAFNLKSVLQQAVLPFKYRYQEKKVGLQIELNNDIDELILADDLRLVQVLNNLLSNALKFTLSGEVKLSAECIIKESKTITIKFSVKDSGIGIDEEDQKKIFESFEQVINENTRLQEGAGLGLAISQRLLELMNSKLQVVSEPGKGSTFFFTCKFSRAYASSEQVFQTKIDYDFKNMSILVVEDNPINKMIVTKMLKDCNAYVETATNGKIALELLLIKSDFNLILLDLQMPEMDGYEAILHMKKMYRDIPVLAFTASLVDEPMKNELLMLGFDGYITKPFKTAELYDKVNKINMVNMQMEKYLQLINN